jgi:phage-related protein
MRQLLFVSSADRDLRRLPKIARDEIGFALYEAQTGGISRFAKPLKGFGSGVFEIALEVHEGAFRAAYVVRLSQGVYVLHVFQKKSKRGIATPQPDIALIRERLKYAEEFDTRG